MDTISANYKLDAWMHENKIDPDFMHYKAMNIRQKVHRMERRHKAGIYTKKQLIEHRAMLANNKLKQSTVDSATTAATTAATDAANDGLSKLNDGANAALDGLKSNFSSLADSISTDIGAQLDIWIPKIQAFLMGFITGSNSISANAVCTSSVRAVVTDFFGLINVRWFWVPDYLMKFQSGYNNLISDSNAAYLYCNFN